MLELKLIQPSGTSVFTAEPGQTIADALHKHGVLLNQVCAGRGVCGKCAVLAHGALSPLTESEMRAFSATQIEAGWRLACIARTNGNCVVTPQHTDSMTRISTGEEYSLSAVHPRYSEYGAAIDIGTTTICVQIYNASGLLCSAASQNPQTAFGADVISRIAASMSGQALALQAAVSAEVESLLTECTCAHGIEPAQVDAMVATGNTAMLYLLGARDTSSLSQAPFLADHLFSETVSGDMLGFKSFGHARCYLPGCFGAYLGADLATAVLQSSIMDKADCALLADVGTNGEIALKHHGVLYCCSTAAGPAFEGAGITQGSLGVPGAIDTVSFSTNLLNISTIGSKPARSICGSGVIDAVTALLDAGVINDTGYIYAEHPLVRDDTGTAYIPLTPNVRFTQKDIRAVQLAKAAIHAGIETLLDICSCKAEDIDAFYIAGGFGAHVNLKNAARIGLFPGALLPKARVLGNAALGGAAMLLQDTEKQTRLDGILKAAKPVSLAESAFFMEQYVDAMSFAG